MMEANIIIQELEKNLEVFKILFEPVDDMMHLFRIQPDYWCLLEVVNHLIDEEKDDFRNRVFVCLDHPGKLPKAFNPLDWVLERKYMEQDYILKVMEFIEERKNSIFHLKQLVNPDWQSGYEHPKLGFLTAFHFLNNWLAHDYLHIRQLTKIRYEYLRMNSEGLNFDYAGSWVA